MKPFQGSTFLKVFIVSSVLAASYYGCKKIDLKRIAAINTDPVTSVTSNSAKANGDIIDMGTNMIDYGFCWSKGGLPTINDNIATGGTSQETGEFSLLISGLVQNTDYSIRSYIKDDAGVAYGVTQYFKTLEQIVGQWLHYDDGVNDDAIGYTTGGSFDVAIRFPKEAIQEYAGSTITKIRFFPNEGAPTEYSVTIWEGENPPTLKAIEFVPNPSINSWTEFTLSQPYPINTSKDLWIGYWVEDSPADTYPAGVDNGPAMTGFGDMISNDDGLTWTALSTIDPPNLDYNWNLQAFIDNAKGESQMLQRKVNERKVGLSNNGDERIKAMPRSRNCNQQN